LRRARRELGLLGAILPGNFFLTIKDAEALRPVFAAGDEVGALFMIHPGLAPGESPPAPFPDLSVYRASSLELQASISQMGITLAFGDLLDSHPNVATQLVNLGGTLPFILERLEAIACSRTPEMPFPRDRLRRLYYGREDFRSRPNHARNRLPDFATTSRGGHGRQGGASRGRT
jgi:predicted TIM-barrel fold metal-dependent hydrolase